MGIFGIIFHIIWANIAAGLVPQQEINTLHELYVHTNGDTWRWRDEIRNGPKWNFTQAIINPCCDSGRLWQGIRCTLPAPQCCVTNCHISSIILGQYRLRGNLDISWHNLKNVTEINLSLNFLTGSIPFNLTQMSLLESLDISMSRLSGTLPTFIGSLSSLRYFDVTSNLFSGPIPSEIGNLTNLNILRVSVNSFSSIPDTFSRLLLLNELEGYSNNFVGSFPSVMCQLSNLRYLSLYSNRFSGPLPSNMGSLIALTSLSIYSNHLEGSIYPLASLTLLKNLGFQRNKFSGTIPSEFGSMSDLRSLYMYQNLLTGPIPDQMESCTMMEDWYCWGNGLSGSIPLFLGSLTNLKSLDFASNYFFGPIPNTVSSLTNLEYMNFNRNDMDGNIPEGIGSLISLNDVQISSNLLSGSIPSSLPQLSKLTMLNLRDNHLKGTLPPHLGNLTMLGQLYLQGNKLEGKITNLLSYYEKMKITHLDLSDNLFSGQIPDALFKLSLLSTLALTSNCFHGQIPSSICEARRVSVLSMDGLSAARDCSHKATFPITGIPIGNSMSGEIPRCIFTLPNLTVLSLTANGFSKSIPNSEIPPSLVNLSLAHNHLTGTIPASIQLHPFTHLDLSNNKLRGEFSYLGISSENNENKQKILLEVNRLSGKLPYLSSKLSHLLHLNILTGNVFSCDQLPRNDEHKETYQCGSSVLDTSIYSFLAITFCVLSGLVVFYTSQWKVDRVIFTETKFIAEELPFLQRFNLSIFGLGGIILGVSFFSIILLLPLYLYRLSSTQYSTHSHLYRWTWTTAYLTGLFPSIYIISVWFILASITVTGCWSVYHAVSHRASPSTTIFGTPRSVVVASFLILANIGIVSTINGLYIFSTFQKQTLTTHYLIQLGLALFKWVWSVFVVPVFFLQPFHSISDKSLVRILFFASNNIIIPSIVAMLSSPSCYKGLLVQADEIVSGYSYQICDTTAILTVNGTDYATCVAESSKYVQVAPLVPPFSYNYMCSSTVLTAYIPVYIYLCCLDLIVAFSFHWLLLRIYPSYSSLPKLLLNKVPGVYWSDFPEWIADSYIKALPIGSPLSRNLDDTLRDSAALDTSLVIMKPESIFVPLLQNLATLLTFGINSPVLAVALALASTMLILQYHYSATKFFYHLRQSPAKAHIVQLLSQTFIDPTSSVRNICWAIILFSCLFISLICWDIAGDQIGWKDSFLLPIFGFSSFVLIYLIHSVYQYYHSLNHPPRPSTGRGDDASVIQISLHQPTTIISGKDNQNGI